MKLAKVLFIGLVIPALGLLVWSTGSFFDLSSPPNIVKFDPGFDRQLALPSKEINDAFNKGLAAVRETQSQGSSFGFWSALATWLAFAASAGVTLVLGWFGRVSAAGGSPETDGIPKRAARIVALLAAAASISTAGGVLARSEASALRPRASDQHKLLIEARPAIAAAKTVDEARDILRDLEINLAR